jgi:tripartite-type tricarboxylate transporter receptor subunit TctC
MIPNRRSLIRTACVWLAAAAVSPWAVQAQSPAGSGSAGTSAGAVATGAGSGPAGAGPAGASTGAWPTRPVRIIAPFAAGGTADVYARLLAQHLQAALAQPVVVDNRPGGNFGIGTEAAARSAPDGYTFVMITSSHSLIEAFGANRHKYQLMRDLVPVGTLTSAQSVLVVHPSVPAQTLGEFIALLRARPDQLSYASTGTGGMLHVAGELFKSMTRTRMVHVPYKVGSTARVDLLEGRVQAMFDTLGGATPFVRSGKLRPLGVTGQHRSPALPDVPTIADAGVPGYDVQVVIGIMAPAGTPPAIIDRVNREMAAMVALPDVRETFTKTDGDPLVMSPADYGKLLHAEIAKWTSVIETAQIKME